MSHSDSTSLKNFIDWSQENGAVIDRSIIFEVTAQTGIRAVASEKIKSSKHPLISVPKCLLITKEDAKKAFDWGDNRKLPTGNPNALTQLYLSKLKFGDHAISSLKPYLDILPLHLNQPYFWHRSQLDLLKGADLILAVHANLVEIWNEWKNLLTEFGIEQEAKTCDLDSFDKLVDYISSNIDRLHSGETAWTSFIAYVWSSAIFRSRAFPELMLEENVENLQTAFLLPVVDLLNHRNGTKVKWTFSDGKVNFISEAKEINAKEELFNNYGDRSNEELLLAYGFVEENNVHDIARLTLQLDSETIANFRKCGVKLDLRESTIKKNCIQFDISLSNSLPLPLLQLFGFLCKLKSESFLTYRSMLEGSDELYKILSSKLDFFKSAAKSDFSKLGRYNNQLVTSTVKKYFAGQKAIFQKAIEEVTRFQKKTLECLNSNEISSFKTFFKHDTTFANSLLFAFGVTTYNDLVSKNCLKQAQLLWIVRIANKGDLTKKLSFQVPDYISETFNEVSSTIVIEKEDVMEYMDFYKKLFPRLTERIPEIFGRGNWGIRQFIVADTVFDRLVWTRRLNGEPHFMKKKEFLIR
ncbi:protein-lysine N-methyltransferase KNAG_0J02970 [Huiozyma naganishii CBS 8797]|uniref:Uncharacterized protein n=1 Tax=Huiozyma naganishii (strain ATCC MYA-139 / BCRC 22969 / CBS 8797 / KCTC 17520 / NBRC 10181 / NCYC 3082 / Yp74L-3) TaxID=1071383 RepID=J7RBU5_HUIN7|nr:hypothetical protein KNAG_0J02970 [Kazachstania naganishii CBS 8797]CCK72375.1 hypothetical protein KNAG_0J02970 [Kazachstania naganishii CBS 8797]